MTYNMSNMYIIMMYSMYNMYIITTVFIFMTYNMYIIIYFQLFISDNNQHIAGYCRTQSMNNLGYPELF